MFIRRVIYCAGASVQTLPTGVNRALHAGVAVFLAMALSCCALLKPNPSGKGTHRQLGLPSCLVCKVAHIERCPSCGMTTGFAYAMRGDFRAARGCNPAAPVAFLLAWAGFAYSAAVALTGRQWLRYEMPATVGLAVVTLIWWVQCLISL